MRWRRLIGALLLAGLAIAIALAGRWPATGEPLAEVDHVLVVVTPKLALRELGSGPLRDVAGRAAVGAMSVRALHTRPGAAEGYVALGSGVRTRSIPAADRERAGLAAGYGAATRRQHARRAAGLGAATP